MNLMIMDRSRRLGSTIPPSMRKKNPRLRLQVLAAIKAAMTLFCTSNHLKLTIFESFEQERGGNILIIKNYNTNKVPWT